MKILGLVSPKHDRAYCQHYSIQTTEQDLCMHTYIHIHRHTHVSVSSQCYWQLKVKMQGFWFYLASSSVILSKYPPHLKQQQTLKNFVFSPHGVMNFKNIYGQVEIFMTLVERAIDLNTADVKQNLKNLFRKQDIQVRADNFNHELCLHKYSIFSASILLSFQIHSKAHIYY